MGYPMLIGAGVGALGSTLMGGSPLKGAALGAAGGGLGQAAGLFSGGAAAGGAGMTGATATSAAVNPLLTETGKIAAGVLESPTASSIGAGNFFNAANASIPTAADIGAGFGADTITNMATSNPSLWEQLKPYATIDNLSGAANIASKYQPKPFSVQSSGGGISKGAMPQGNDVSSLIASLKLPERKRISLL